MMLRHSFKQEENAVRIERAVEQALADGARGFDLGGSAGTRELADAVLSRL